MLANVLGLNGIDSTQDISRSTFNQLLVEHPRNFSVDFTLWHGVMH